MIVIDFKNKIKEKSAFIENREFENHYIFIVKGGNLQSMKFKG